MLGYTLATRRVWQEDRRREKIVDCWMRVGGNESEEQRFSRLGSIKKCSKRRINEDTGKGRKDSG